MAFANINNHRLYFEDTGGLGPAVIFSHGFCLDHSMWDGTVSILRDSFRCITWDERGHGMSDCNGAFDFYDSASDLVGLLDHLGIAQATLVGLSQGGFLSQRAAVGFPERVAALVLMDTGARVFPQEVIDGYVGMQDAWLANGPVSEIAEGMAGLLFGPEFDSSAWIGKWQSKPPEDLREAWKTVIGRDEFFARVAEIKCPSLVVHGSLDQAFDMSVAEELRDTLGDCKGLVVVEGGFHVPPVTHPVAVAEALHEFLNSYAV
ncbi:MAG: 3-oxoadipate enol-lactonase [Hyphomicrobiaceae bacterium]|jgi:3-oxoadipate enol-lactonase